MMLIIPKRSTQSVEFIFPVPTSPWTTISIKVGRQRCSIGVVDSSDPYPCLIGLFNAVADGYSGATELTDGLVGYIVRVMPNEDVATARLQIYEAGFPPQRRASEIDANICVVELLASFSCAYKKLALLRNGPAWIPASLARIDQFVANNG